MSKTAIMKLAISNLPQVRQSWCLYHLDHHLFKVLQTLRKVFGGLFRLRHCNLKMSKHRIVSPRLIYLPQSENTLKTSVTSCWKLNHHFSSYPEEMVCYPLTGLTSRATPYKPLRRYKNTEEGLSDTQNCPVNRSMENLMGLKTRRGRPRK